MAKKIDLKKSIRGLNFFIKSLPFFGSKQRTGDQFIFDQRGAIRITDKEITKANGEIVKIRGIQDAGGVAKSFTPNDPLVLARPAASNNVDPASAMGAYHSWPFAAIKPIADELACIEWRVFKVDGKGKTKEVEDHELIDFLECVNDFQTGPEFRHTMAVHLELTSNAYVLLMGKNGEPVRTYDEKPTAMHLLDPGRVKIQLDQSTYPYRLVNYKFVIDGKQFVYQPYQILQLKYPNPTGRTLQWQLGWRGGPPMAE